MSEIYSWFKGSGQSPLSCLVRGYISECLKSLWDFQQTRNLLFANFSVHAQKPLKWFLTNDKRWFNWKTYLMSWKNYLADVI